MCQERTTRSPMHCPGGLIQQAQIYRRRLSMGIHSLTGLPWHRMSLTGYRISPSFLSGVNLPSPGGEGSYAGDMGLQYNQV